MNTTSKLMYLRQSNSEKRLRHQWKGFKFPSCHRSGQNSWREDFRLEKKIPFEW